MINLKNIFTMLDTPSFNSYCKQAVSSPLSPLSSLLSLYSSLYPLSSLLSHVSALLSLYSSLLNPLSTLLTPLLSLLYPPLSPLLSFPLLHQTQRLPKTYRPLKDQSRTRLSDSRHKALCVCDPYILAYHNSRELNVSFLM